MSIWLIHSDCFHNNDGSFDTDSLFRFSNREGFAIAPTFLFVRRWCCYRATDLGGICYYKLRYFRLSPSAAIINAATYYTGCSFAIDSVSPSINVWNKCFEFPSR